jgi:hypothetical protein
MFQHFLQLEDEGIFLKAYRKLVTKLSWDIHLKKVPGTGIIQDQGPVYSLAEI